MSVWPSFFLPLQAIWTCIQMFNYFFFNLWIFSCAKYSIYILYTHLNMQYVTRTNYYFGTELIKFKYNFSILHIIFIGFYDLHFIPYMIYPISLVVNLFLFMKISIVPEIDCERQPDLPGQLYWVSISYALPLHK